MELTESLRRKFGDAVFETHDFRGDVTIVVPREKVVEICRGLKDDPEYAFSMLIDQTAVDYLPRDPRFEVVYHLYSLEKKHRLRVKTRVPEKDPVMDTVCSVWAAANWFEREIWDMYGIRFKGHPDLRRILLYEEFVGFPLRKDYPKTKRQPLIGPRN